MPAPTPGSADHGADEARLVERALTGAPGARAELVAHLESPIHHGVAAALYRRARATGDAPRRSELLDLVHESLVALLEDDGRLLRRWEPTRGASLRTYAGAVAERVAAGFLRSGRRGAAGERPVGGDTMERLTPAAPSAEAQVADRQFLGALLDRMRATLSPRGLTLFRALFVQQRSAAEVAAEHDMSVDALYAWRSRTRKQARAFADELSAPQTRPGGRDVR